MSNILDNKFKNIYSKVKWILETYPVTRGDDALLVSMYWYNWDKDYINVIDGCAWISLSAYEYKLTPPSIIERARRKAQADAVATNDLQKMLLYLPKDEKILERRRIHCKVWRDYMRDLKEGQGNLWGSD